MSSFSPHPCFHIGFEIFTPDNSLLSSFPTDIREKVFAFGDRSFPTSKTDIFDPNLPCDSFRSVGLSAKQELAPTVCAQAARQYHRTESTSTRPTSRRASSLDLGQGRQLGTVKSIGKHVSDHYLRPARSHVYHSTTETETETEIGAGTEKKHPGKEAARHIDYRFSFITVESIDMEKRAENDFSVDSATGSQNLMRRQRTKSFMFPDAAKPASAVTKAEYIPLRSKVTGFGYGIVHLYREIEGTGQGVVRPNKSITEKALGSEAGADLSPESDPEDLTTVAILAVPSYMTPSDFLGFVGEDTRDSVSHFRMIRTGDNSRRYMVLMKFRAKQSAREFVQTFNSRVFNSMEPETCHVVYVRSIRFQSSENSSVADEGSITARQDGAPRLHPTSAYPDITNDPFSPSHSPQPHEVTVDPSDSEPPPPYQTHSPTLKKSLSTKPAPPPTPSLLELPTCPVCLERMDETTGLLTIQCQHVFHCACLSKWKDSSCPVCRYSSMSGVSSSRRRTGTRGVIVGEGDNDDDLNMCNTCGAMANLWICLICGNVGCGRYDEKHAYGHFLETSHCFAMDVDSQRVWDYASDAYVHRLIQNKSDGKLVELPANSSTMSGVNEGDVVPVEKLENICMEYTHLLTSQLDSQRMYFEEQLLAAADKTSSAISKADEASQVADTATTELGSVRSKYNELQLEVLPNLEKSKERAEKKAEKAVEMLRKVDKDFRDEKAVSNGLMERVEVLSKENTDLKEQNNDLREQIRDLMFFLEGRDKLKEMNEEGIEEGVATVGEAGADKSKKKRKGKGKGKS